MKTLHTLLSKDNEKLLHTLKVRFEKNKTRYLVIEWLAVQTKLENNNGKLWSLNEMEKTGGEPVVVGNEIIGVANTYTKILL